MKPKRERESGFALLLVFLMASMIAISLYMEMPRVAFESQRAREQMAIQRGLQYQRGIQLFYRKFRTYPTTLDDLETTRNIRFLRRRYTDPLTGKEFRLVHVGPGGVLTDSLVHPATNPADNKGNPSASNTGAPNAGASNTAQASTADPNGQNAAANPLNMAQRRPSDRNIGGGQELPQGAVDPNQQLPYPQPGQPPDGNPPQYPAQYPPQPGQPTYPGTGTPQYPVQPGQAGYPGQMPYPNQPGYPQGQPVVYPGQPNQYPGQPGQPNPYPGLPNQYPGQQPYPNPTGQPQYPGQPQGQPQYPGQPVVYPQPGYPSSPGVQPGISGQPYPGQPAYPGQYNPSGGASPQQAVPGVPGAASNQAVNMIQTLLTTPRQPPSNLGTNGVSGGGVGIAGVASTADGEGIHVINDRHKYKEWEFIYDIKNDKTALGAVPGQMPGTTPAIPGLPGNLPQIPTGPGSPAQPGFPQQSGFPQNPGFPQVPGFPRPPGSPMGFPPVPQQAPPVR